MTLNDWCSHLVRRLLGTAAVCVLVGVLLYLARGRSLWGGMLYAFTIGLQISLYISTLQHGLTLWLSRYGASNPALAHGWVGWSWMLPCILLGSALGYVGGLWLGDLLTGQRSSYPWEQSGTAALVSLAFVVMISLLTTAGFVAHFKLQALKLAQAESQRQAAEAQLTLLQSQLEPHMLFNTLAHLRVLIKLRPDEAQAMLDQLIAYLRATLQASRASSHSLAEEFARLADYLSLMKLRMGDRLQVELDLPPDLAGTSIPPLLLQPLVENAVKHGLEPHVQGGLLRVTATRSAQGLTLQVSDSGSGLRQGDGTPGTGFGLNQVRERLAHRYGAHARFELAGLASGGSVATITIAQP